MFFFDLRNQGSTFVYKAPIHREGIQNGTDQPNFPEFQYRVIVKSLMVKTSNWDSIKNLSPAVIIERHKKEQPGRNKHGGFHKSISKYISKIPLTSADQLLDLNAEDYFDIQTEGLNAEDELRLVNPILRARGIKGSNKNRKQHLRLKLSLTIGGGSRIYKWSYNLCDS